MAKTEKGHGDGVHAVA